MILLKKHTMTASMPLARIKRARMLARMAGLAPAIKGPEAPQLTRTAKATQAYVQERELLADGRALLAALDEKSP